MSEQDANVERQRVVADYKNAILRSVEHDEAWGQQAYSPNYDKYQMRWNQERSKQLDENEAVAKSQYEEHHGEVETGLSADGYRSQVIGERVEQQMAADSDQKNNETKSDVDRTREEKTDFRNNYWESSNDKASADASASAAETKTGDKENYWDKGASAGAEKGESGASAQQTVEASNQTGATEQKSAEMDKSL